MADSVRGKPGDADYNGRKGRMTVDYAERLDQYVTDGRLIRGTWRGRSDDGRETVCLLAAMSPEVRSDSSECPEAICPAWWARLTVSIDDAGTLEHWPEVVRRYASLAHRWHVLTVDGWRRLRHACCAAIVHEAISHAKRQDVRLACERVIALCYRGVAGDYPSAGEWQKGARRRRLRRLRRRLRR